METTATPPPPPRGRDRAGFDRDMQDFLINLEVSAKTIIKRDTKRRLAEAKRVNMLLATTIGSSGGTVTTRSVTSPSSPPRKRRLNDISRGNSNGANNVILIDPVIGSGKHMNKINSGIGAGLSFDRKNMAVSVSRLAADQKVVNATTLGPSAWSPATQSGPQYEPVMAATRPQWPEVASDGKSGFVSSGSNNQQAQESGSGKLLPPLRRSAQIKQQLQSIVDDQKEEIHPVFFSNPLYKPKDNKTAKKRMVGTDMKLFSGGGKDDGGKQAGASSKTRPRKEMHCEPQGPMSWTSDDLRIKYRSEESREAAWTASKAAEAASEQLRLTEGIIVPYAVVERHPLYMVYYDLVRGELRRAIERARARNRMKRFVSDVHTVWLTNLAALREHSHQRHQLVPRGKGLDDRRDVVAISSFSSQIPSVSKDRAIRGAVFPTHEAPQQLPCPVRFPRHTPLLEAPPSPPPRFWTLLDCETLHVRALQREYHCFIHRLLMGPAAEPLWRVSLYDVQNGDETVNVVKEDAVVASVRRHILMGGGDNGFQDRVALRKSWVHKQGCRVPWGEGRGAVLSLITIMVCAGPHDTVLVEISAHPYTIHSMGVHKIKLTTNEVKARLSLIDAPALDLAYWKATKGQHAMWRNLVSLIRYNRATTTPTTTSEADGSTTTTTTSAGPHPIVAGAFLDDRAVRQQEGFDFYGMLATGYALLPLVRVTPYQTRKGTSYTMAIPDVQPIEDNKPPVAAKGGGAPPPLPWEDLSDFNLSMSVRVCGRMSSMTRVPGTCSWGKAGIWYPSAYPLALREYTQGVMSFFRDKSMSSTDSVLALFALALDTPCMTPSLLAWEAESSSPYQPPEEPPNGIVPAFVATPVTLLKTPVVSSADDKKSTTIVLLTAAEEGADYAADSLAEIMKRGEHRRRSPECDADGFGLLQRVQLLVPNANTPTYIFGITSQGASFNLPRTTGRFIWHSDQRCVEEIVRQRTPKDYAYVSKKVETVGANDPKVFTVCTRHGKFYRMVHGGFKDLLAEYERIRRKEEKAAKEEALRVKMVAAYAKVEANKKAEDMLAEQARAKEMAKLMKHGPLRARTSLARWKKRLANSALLAARGKWEKRRHKESGNLFYFNTEKHAVKAFSYDPPTQEWMEAEGGGGEGKADQQGEEREKMSKAMVVAANAGDAGAGAMVLVSSYDGDGGGGSHGVKQQQSTALSSGSTGVSGDANSVGIAMTDVLSETMSKTGEEGATVSGVTPGQLDDLGRRQARKLEDILDEMANNDVLIGKLADRLGAQAFVPLMKRDPTVEPAERVLEEDDRAWSDSEDEVGDDEYEEGYLMQDWAAKYQADKQERAIFAKEMTVPKHMRPSIVPTLAIQQRVDSNAANLEAHTLGRGWRRLPRPEVKGGFVASMLRRRTQGVVSKELNRPSKPTIIPAQSPLDLGMVAMGTGGGKAWTSDYKTENRFISNVLEDVEMNVEMIQSRLEREARLAKGGGLSQIVAASGLDVASDGGASAMVAANAEVDMADRLYRAEKRALAAVAAGDFEKLEAAVDDDKVNVNCMDEFGNTLLILASQQGSKRMVKFLLRRGANMNAQNFAGNTVLHYAYAYNHEDLGRYLETKGADSGLLNAAGLTCYEGLRQKDVNDL